MTVSGAVPWRLRRDLEVVAVDGGAAWVVKDPIRLRYFRLPAEEWAFLRSLDGGRSFEELRTELSRQFPGVRFPMPSLLAFLNAAITNALVTSRLPGVGGTLETMDRRRRGAARKARLFAAFSHRFRGIDPTPVLRLLDATIGIFVRPTTLVIAAVVWVLGAVTLLSRLPQIECELPRLAEFATASNLAGLAVALAVTKLLHELGHAYACYRLGGECRELGVLVVGFFPLLYCDVSDSWRMPHRWQRMLVVAAGMIVELVLAVACGLLWLASVPGWTHTLLLQVAIVCSVNTLLVNGNPLLRYDGYYLLSDALSLPNLMAHSKAAVDRLFDRLVLGLPYGRTLGRTPLAEAGLVLFGIASAIYRLVVLALILYAIDAVLRPHGLEAISHLLVALSVAGLAVAAIRGVRRRTREAAEHHRSRRALAGLLVGLTILVGLSLLPLPYDISAPAVRVPLRATPVYVTLGGRLESAVRYGDRLEQGDRIAALSDPMIARRLADSEAVVRVREEQLRQLQTRRVRDPDASAALPPAIEAVEAAKRRAGLDRNAAAELMLTSPDAGRLLPPRVAAKPGGEHLGDDLDLDETTHRTTAPLDPENKGNWLEPQTLLGWIDYDEAVRLRAYVTEEQLPALRVGAAARFVPRSDPFDGLDARLTRIERTPVDRIAPELVAIQAAPVRSPTDGRPTRTMYAIELTLADPGGKSLAPAVPLYSVGHVAIDCASRSVARRLYDYLRSTFGLPLRVPRLAGKSARND